MNWLALAISLGSVGTVGAALWGAYWWRKAVGLSGDLGRQTEVSQSRLKQIQQLEEEVARRTEMSAAAWQGRTEDAARLERVIAFLKTEIADQDSQLRLLAHSVLPASTIGTTPGGGLVGVSGPVRATPSREPPDGE